MAVRRMFSKNILLTDKFFDMNTKAQLLYYNLNLEADDDGFIQNPKRLLRSLGATLRHYNELITKGYIISFDSGVAVISHWRVHNQIRKDRYTPTLCREELEQLTVDENNVYITATKRQPTVAKRVTASATQGSIGKDSIGKVSIGEGEYMHCSDGERADAKNIAAAPVPAPAHKKKYGEFKNVILSESEYEALLYEHGDITPTIERLSQYMAATGKEYASHYAVLQRWAREDKPEPKPISDNSSYDINEFFELALKRSNEKILAKAGTSPCTL